MIKLNEIFCQGMLITLSAIALKKFSIKNLKGKNVTIKKSINLFILLCLSAYPFWHIIQTNGGLQGTKQNTFMYSKKSYIIRLDVTIVIEPTTPHFYELKRFIFCNLWKIDMIADRLMCYFSQSTENNVVSVNLLHYAVQC